MLAVAIVGVGCVALAELLFIVAALYGVVGMIAWHACQLVQRIVERRTDKFLEGRYHFPDAKSLDLKDVISWSRPKFMDWVRRNTLADGWMRNMMRRSLRFYYGKGAVRRWWARTSDIDAMLWVLMHTRFAQPVIYAKAIDTMLGEVRKRNHPFLKFVDDPGGAQTVDGWYADTLEEMAWDYHEWERIAAACREGREVEDDIVDKLAYIQPIPHWRRVLEEGIDGHCRPSRAIHIHQPSACDRLRQLMGTNHE